MKIIKAWAVIWTYKARKQYGVPLKDTIVSVEPKDDINVIVFKRKKKFYYADSIAVFSKRKEAESFRNGNIDWLSTPCEISFNEEKAQ